LGIGEQRNPDSTNKVIPPEEAELISNFLQKFVFVTDSTAEQLDLKLALKVLPLRIDANNLYRVGLINFEMI